VPVRSYCFTTFESRMQSERQASSACCLRHKGLLLVFAVCILLCIMICDILAINKTITNKPIELFTLVLFIICRMLRPTFETIFRQFQCVSCFLLGLLFDIEYGGDMFLRNASKLCYIPEDRTLYKPLLRTPHTLQVKT
jgi:hypothetical protein